MKNTDLVTFVGYSRGGKGVYGDFGVKVRFAIDQTRRTKELYKLGASEVTFFALPKPMLKSDAVKYLENLNDKSLTEQVIKDAIARAHERLIASN